MKMSYEEFEKLCFERAREEYGKQVSYDSLVLRELQDLYNRLPINEAIKEAVDVIIYNSAFWDNELI